VSTVVLYSSGVAYFERTGTVKGDATVDLRFKVGDINDLLKSLVVQDLGGGQVSTVTYGNRDPLSKTLRSFAVDLTGSPGLGDILNQVRGERVEVAAPGRVVGTVLGVEKKREVLKDGTVVETELLNLAGEEGLRSLPLPQVQRVKILNPALEAELAGALAALASGHDQQKKAVGLVFAGKDERPVRVGYVTENPVWKTSYRLIVPGEGNAKPLMQGWALVENTTDEDWNDVNLSLVSGRPISFIQDLYQPLYVPRPVVEPELYASLRPQTYEGDLRKFEEAKLRAELPNADRDGEPAAKASAAPPAPGFAGRGGGRGANRRELLDRAARDDKPLDASGLAAQASGAAAGELFKYSVRLPVTLPRQKSAMIPIINAGVEAKRVSIYNEAVQARHPLSGLRLKNTTGLHLSQGPVTVYADGVYAGDARIEDVKPDEERLISYGLDLAVTVAPSWKPGSGEVLSVSLKRGTLHVRRRVERVREYEVSNADDKPRTVLLEQPIEPQWKLVEPEKPSEKTPALYRFAVEVPAKKAGRLTVREERPISEQVSLTNMGGGQILVLLREPHIAKNDKVSAALKRVVELRGKLDEAVRARGAVESRVNEISVEQDRIRRNMAGLPQNSELYGRYVKKLDDQETEIEKLRKELAAKRAEEDAARKALDEFLVGLDIE
jgi:hypothetical protein